jgi:hypothetical protein
MNYTYTLEQFGYEKKRNKKDDAHREVACVEGDSRSRLVSIYGPQWLCSWLASSYKSQ